MPGRKNPEPTESEKEREYYMHEKIQKGEKLVGERAEGIEDQGPVGEVRDRRREWNKEHPEHQDDYI